MMQIVWALFLLVSAVSPLHAQSLYLNAGEHAVEGGVAWSVGPSSTTATDRRWFFRSTLIEESFRREIYRGARLSVFRRL